MVYTFLPFTILPVYAAARVRLPARRAARDLGARPFQAFRRVFLPGIRRGILIAVLVVFIPSLGPISFRPLSSPGRRDARQQDRPAGLHGPQSAPGRRLRPCSSWPCSRRSSASSSLSASQEGRIVMGNRVRRSRFPSWSRPWSWPFFNACPSYSRGQSFNPARYSSAGRASRSSGTGASGVARGLAGP